MRVPSREYASRRLLLSCVLCGLCFVVLGSAGCGKHSGSAVPLVVALFDVSSAEVPAATRQQYFDDFKRNVIEPLQHGQGLSGETILADVTGQTGSGYGYAATDWPVRVTFPVFDRSTATLDAYHKTVHALADTLSEQAEQVVMNSAPAPASDLMDAIKSADRAFSTDQGRAAPSKTLIVFSDMFVQSTRHDFSTDALSSAGINSLIQDERSGDRLPDLTGVKVWVSGPGTGSRSGISSGKSKQVKAFWTEYFKACGADLPEKHYAERLAKFSLIAGK